MSQHEQFSVDESDVVMVMDKHGRLNVYFPRGARDGDKADPRSAFMTAMAIRATEDMEWVRELRAWFGRRLKKHGARGAKGK